MPGTWLGGLANRSLLTRRKLVRGCAAAALTVALPVTALAATRASQPSVAERATAVGMRSKPAAAPPPVKILRGSAVQGKGDIFITPTGGGTSADGPEILSPTGKEIWFKAVPSGETATDFRTQSLDGKTVLTFWVGTHFGGLSNGTDYILNRDYQQIATVKAGNGLRTDGHDFLITPQNTALILSYDTARANLTSIGGEADQKVVDGIVQEIDIKTGKVLWQWNSADHVPFSQSEVPLPESAGTPWDWFHINAVDFGPDGTLLIDSRYTWTVYDVNRSTGSIEWRLGGKDSSFKLETADGQKLDDAGEIFAFQHDPEYLGRDTLTVFDNEDGEYSYSRTATIKLDFATHTATLEKSNAQPEGRIVAAEGSAQTLPNGDQFVDWGSLPYFSEFSASGTLLSTSSFRPAPRVTAAMCCRGVRTRPRASRAERLATGNSPTPKADPSKRSALPARRSADTSTSSSTSSTPTRLTRDPQRASVETRSRSRAVVGIPQRPAAVGAVDLQTRDLVLWLRGR